MIPCSGLVVFTGVVICDESIRLHTSDNLSAITEEYCFEMT